MNTLITPQRLLAVLMCFSFAIEAKTVTVTPRWKTGDSVRYVVVKRVSIESNGKTTHKPARASQITLRVLKKLRDGYLIDWQFTPVGVSSEAQAELKKALPEFYRVFFEGFHVILQVDASATPVAIQNAKEIASRVDRALKEFERYAAEHPEDPRLAEFQKLISESEPLRSEQFLTSFYLRQAEILFLPIGGTYNFAAPEITENTLPNPAGGAPFSARLTSRLTSFEQKQQHATIEVTNQIGAEQNAAAVQQLFRATRPKSAENAPAPKVATLDHGKYKVALRTGWPEHVEWSRIAEVETKGILAQQHEERGYERIDIKASHLATLQPELAFLSSFAGTFVRVDETTKPFFATVMKVGFRRQADGAWQFDDAPIVPIHKPDAYLGCPVELSSIEDSIAFKPSMEIYLRHSKNWPKNLVVKVGEKAVSGNSNKSGCVRFTGNATHVLSEYLKPGSDVSILAGDKTIRHFTPPAGFYPFTLVRYWDGQILPTPARLDTVIFGEDPNYVLAIYRASFPAVAPIRKVEIRTVLPGSYLKGSENESREQELARSQAMRIYLDTCPVPTVAGGEACGANNYVINPQLLIPALGG